MLRSLLRRQKSGPKKMVMNAGRGRLYDPQSAPQPGIMEPVEAQGKAIMTMRVYRAETDTWEDQDVEVELDAETLKHIQEI